MEAESILTGYRQKRLSFFRWRAKQSIARKVCLALGAAAVTGIAAQIRIPLPFTPVPITGQVFAVLLSGALLGRLYGGLSQLIYVVLGGLGLPWFAGLSGGFSVLTGVTGGYIFGFVVSAGLIGWITDRYKKARTLAALLSINLTAIGIIYLFGATQLSIILKTDLQKTIQLAVVPFIWVDLIKALIVSMICFAMFPKRDYHSGEQITSDGII